MDLSKVNILVVAFGQPGCPACEEYMPRFKIIAAKHPEIPSLILDANSIRSEIVRLANRVEVYVTPSTYILRRGRGSIVGEGSLTDEEIEYLFAVAGRYIPPTQDEPANQDSDRHSDQHL